MKWYVECKRFYVSWDVNFDENTSFQDLQCNVQVYQPQEELVEKKEQRRNENESLEDDDDNSNIYDGGMFEPRSSQRVRKPVEILTYHSLFVEHCLFMSIIEHCMKPSSYVNWA